VPGAGYAELMNVDWSGWLLFGLVATIVLTALITGAQLMGISRMDLPLMLGTLVTERPDVAHVIGVVIHLVNGWVFALMYAVAFAMIGRATWWMGALFGAVHGIAALSFVPFLPGVHPRMASERTGPSLGAALEPPGWLALNYGRSTPAVTLLAHVVYGSLLGGFLGPH
jgi:hypothetical protein